MMGDKAENLHGLSHLKPANLEGAIQLTEVDLLTSDPEVEEVLDKHMKSKVIAKRGLFDSYY